MISYKMNQFFCHRPILRSRSEGCFWKPFLSYQKRWDCAIILENIRTKRVKPSLHCFSTCKNKKKGGSPCPAAEAAETTVICFPFPYPRTTLMPPYFDVIELVTLTFDRTSLSETSDFWPNSTFTLLSSRFQMYAGLSKNQRCSFPTGRKQNGHVGKWFIFFAARTANSLSSCGRKVNFLLRTLKECTQSFVGLPFLNVFHWVVLGLRH